HSLSAYFSFCLSFLSWFFFSQCYPDPRDLHSFPTRRSSDLTGLSSATSTSRSTSSTCFATRASCPATCPTSSACARLPAWCGFRSEEHTSELQSRENLVCRLLLEKKKKK